MAWECKCDGPGNCPHFNREMVGRQFQICKGTTELPEHKRRGFVERWAEGTPVADTLDKPTRWVDKGTSPGAGCCGQPAPRSLLQRAADAAAAVVDVWQVGLALATREQVRHRKAVCNACPIRRGRWCAPKPEGCGCFLPLKRKARAAACPQGKWSAHTE